MRIPQLFETLWADVKFAARGLRKSPGFLVVVVLSLALGIAANSTIFSVLNALLYRPLPYPQPQNLVVIWQVEQAHPDNLQAPPIAENVDWMKQNHVFEDISLNSFTDQAIVSGMSQPRPLHTQYVTPDFFAQLARSPSSAGFFRRTSSKTSRKPSSSALPSGSANTMATRACWEKLSTSKAWFQRSLA